LLIIKTTKADCYINSISLSVKYQLQEHLKMWILLLTLHQLGIQDHVLFSNEYHIFKLHFHTW